MGLSTEISQISDGPGPDGVVNLFLYCWNKENGVLILPIHDTQTQQSLLLPEDIEITGYMGMGGRAQVYQALLDQHPVVVKVYINEVAQKYRRRYGVDIAEFEFQRNQALFALDDIKKYVARPYRVYPMSGEYTHSMIQECIVGQKMKALVTELGYLPDEVLASGYELVKHAEAHGLHDLDISSGNIIVSKLDGIWIPRIYDFNLMPQHLHAPNPFLGLGLTLGLRSKSYRDYRNLKKWERRGKLAQINSGV